MDERKIQTEIQVGPPIESKVDYSASREALQSCFEQWLAAVGAGEKDRADVEMVLLGYALDFIDFAKQAAEVTLTFEEDSVPALDQVLGQLHTLSEKGKIPKDYLELLVKKATGFFGVLILKNLGGNWAHSDVGMVVRLSGMNVFVYNHIARCVVSGEEDVCSLYQAFRMMVKRKQEEAKEEI